MSKKRSGRLLSPGAEDPIREALEQINRLLSSEAEEQMSGAARESVSQLRLPTLDERVSLYLAAVYGKRDFGNEAYSDARNRILDAMAADIASKAGIDLADEVEHPRLRQDANPNETGLRPDLLDYQHRNASANAGPLPSEPLVLRALFEHSADFLAHLPAAAARTTMAAFADALENEPRSPRKIEPGKRPSLKLAMLAASLCAVAVIGGSVTFLVLREFGVVPKSDKFAVADQSSQTQAALTGLDSPSVTKLTPTVNVPSVMNQLTPEEIADLLKRGRELIAAGKIGEARLLLKSAAVSGDATAAFTLATTYDPVELEKLGARDADPDISEARAWYQKAKDLGSTAAPQTFGR